MFRAGLYPPHVSYFPNHLKFSYDEHSINDRDDLILCRRHVSGDFNFQQQKSAGIRRQHSRNYRFDGSIALGVQSFVNEQSSIVDCIGHAYHGIIKRLVLSTKS